MKILYHKFYCRFLHKHDFSFFPPFDQLLVFISLVAFDANRGNWYPTKFQYKTIKKSLLRKKVPQVYLAFGGKNKQDRKYFLTLHREIFNDIELKRINFDKMIEYKLTNEICGTEKS